VPPFVLAQVVGAAIAAGVALVLWPRPAAADPVALDVVAETR
jgi:glycerol uptake facilitator-like aquaporin